MTDSIGLFFISYLFALFRRSESEYEDAEDPFPKGTYPVPHNSPIERA